jgi:hypothetical protein
VTPTTSWIRYELEAAIRTAFDVPAIFGAADVAGRERHALVELRLLSGASSAVLWPGSTFSQLAGLHLAARNASFGFVPRHAPSSSRHARSQSPAAAAEAAQQPLCGWGRQLAEPALVGERACEMLFGHAANPPEEPVHTTDLIFNRISSASKQLWARARRVATAVWTRDNEASQER